jgi:hypothetical protein
MSEGHTANHTNQLVYQGLMSSNPYAVRMASEVLSQPDRSAGTYTSGRRYALIDRLWVYAAI